MTHPRMIKLWVSAICLALLLGPAQAAAARAPRRPPAWFQHLEARRRAPPRPRADVCETPERGRWHAVRVSAAAADRDVDEEHFHPARHVVRRAGRQSDARGRE